MGLSKAPVYSYFHRFDLRLDLYYRLYHRRQRRHSGRVRRYGSRQVIHLGFFRCCAGTIANAGIDIADAIKGVCNYYNHRSDNEFVLIHYFNYIDYL